MPQDETSRKSRLVHPMRSVWVEGKPIPQGSMRALVSRTTGKTLVLPASNHLGPWREKVRLAGSSVAFVPWLGPCEVRLDFGVVRPQRPRSPWPLTRATGDLDKLERAILDALTGVWWVDDSQVVSMASHKRYAEPGVRVRAWLLDGDPD